MTRADPQLHADAISCHPSTANSLLVDPKVFQASGRYLDARAEITDQGQIAVVLSVTIDQ